MFHQDSGSRNRYKKVQIWYQTEDEGITNRSTKSVQTALPSQKKKKKDGSETENDVLHAPKKSDRIMFECEVVFCKGQILREMRQLQGQQ